MVVDRRILLATSIYLLCTIFLVGCKPKTELNLIGQWKQLDVESSGITEFREDGTWLWAGSPGSYELLPDNRIKGQVDETPNAYFIATYTIEGEKLTFSLVEVNGKPVVPPDTAIYERVKQ